jgi:hypothetical protein
MAEVLGQVHKGGSELLQGRWWPVGPKLVFNQKAALAPEIMDNSGSLGSFLLMILSMMLHTQY